MDYISLVKKIYSIPPRNRLRYRAFTFWKTHIILEWNILSHTPWLYTGMAKITGLTYQLLRVKLSITMVVPTEITASSFPSDNQKWLAGEFHISANHFPNKTSIYRWFSHIFPIKPAILPIFSPIFPNFLVILDAPAATFDRGSPDPGPNWRSSAWTHPNFLRRNRNWIWCRVAGAAIWSRNHQKSIFH